MPLESHPSIAKTLEQVKRNFYWPRLAHDVHLYCATCEPCAARKGHRKQIKPFLKPIAPLPKPLDFVTIDVLRLPLTKRGNNCLLIAVSYLSKVLFVEAMRDETAKSLSLAYQAMFKLTGYPCQLLSDQGSNFQLQQFQDLCLHMNMKRNLTTSFRPQSDGETERHNRTLITQLSTAILETGYEWDELLSSTCLAFNTMQHSTTQKCPHELVYNQPPSLPAFIFSFCLCR